MIGELPVDWNADVSTNPIAAQYEARMCTLHRAPCTVHPAPCTVRENVHCALRTVRALSACAAATASSFP